MGRKDKYAFVLDRDEFVRLSLKKILHKYGFQVEEIEFFSEIEDRKKEIDQGIVLADVEMDVLEKWIPVLKRWSDHFVLMSPKITDELKVRLKKMGLSRMIKKPVEPKILKRVIREICPSREERSSSPKGGDEKGRRSF